MSSFLLSPMFADVPKGIDILTTVYMQGGNDLRVDRPGLRCIRAKGEGTELYFDAEAAAELAAYLKSQKVDRADFDFEPADGWTPRNRRIAERTIAEFKAAGVWLRMWGTPLEGDTLEWMAEVSGHHLTFAAYPISQDPALWRVTRLGELATVRKRCRGATVAVEVCPHWIGAKEYDGRPLPPWREYVGGVLWDTYVKFARDYGDEQGVWASGLWERVGPDGNMTSGYDPFDYKAPWAGVFGGH